MSSQSENLKNKINSMKSEAVGEDFFKKIEQEVLSNIKVHNEAPVPSNNFVFLPLSGNTPMIIRMDKPTPFNTKVVSLDETTDRSSDSMGSSLLDSLLPKPGIREQFEGYLMEIKNQESIIAEEVGALNAQLDGMEKRARDISKQEQIDRDLAAWKKKKSLKEKKTVRGVPFSMNSKRDSKETGLRI